MLFVRGNPLRHAGRHGRQPQESARCGHAHALVFLLVEMSTGGVDGEQEVGFHDQSTLQKAVVGLEKKKKKGKKGSNHNFSLRKKKKGSNHNFSLRAFVFCLPQKVELVVEALPTA